MNFMQAMRKLVSGGTVYFGDVPEDVRLCLMVGLKRGELVWVNSMRWNAMQNPCVLFLDETRSAQNLNV